MKAVLDQHPELGIVQDADRLDAIGAIGVGRTFAFTGAKMPGRSMTETIEHFHDKLERLHCMMKVCIHTDKQPRPQLTPLQTNTGKQLARERTDRLETFRRWWDEEYEITS